MSVTTQGTEGESQHGATTAPAGAPPTPLLMNQAGTTDRCSTCGAEMAPDQRYCVECGTRRGKARFALQSTGLSPAPAPAAVAVQPRGGWTSGTTLLAGIAVLLLAIGVGVLIGHAVSNSGTQKPVNNITVNGGGSGGGTSAATTGNTGSGAASTGSTSNTSGSSGSSSSKKKSVKASTGSNTVAAKKNTPPPSSGVSSSVTKTPTVKPGGSCTAGTPGCTNGKETGNFFG